MKILITGCCGFIGTNLCEFILTHTDMHVIGIDNLTGNYDKSYKQQNLSDLRKFPRFKFYQENIVDSEVIQNELPDQICHLASLTGVRQSMSDGREFAVNNIVGFVHILEQARIYNVKRVLYASSSSVYGANNKIPFTEADQTDNIRSSYACSKKCCEIYAKFYWDVYGLPVIGFRFFTVYGERGRPDMSPYIFLKKIAEGKEIMLYGDGSSCRDYTYITDIIGGLMSAIGGNGQLGAIYNLGGNVPVDIKTFISVCEEITGNHAIINIQPAQLGDVPYTCADISKACRDLSYVPQISLKEGLRAMYRWMVDNNRIERLYE